MLNVVMLNVVAPPTREKKLFFSVVELKTLKKLAVEGMMG